MGSLAELVSKCFGMGADATTFSNSGTTGAEIMAKIKEAEARLNSRRPLPSTRLIESSFLTKSVQARFPRCKSRRIANKWRKNPKNFKTIPSTDVFVTPWGMIAHPETIRELEGMLGNERKRHDI
jgi:hypothetical protein